MPEQDDGPAFRSTVVYRDNRAALEWLEKAFGFEVSLIVTDQSGNIGHAEMKFAGGVIIVAPEWSEIAKSPKSVGGINTQQLHVYLSEDLDAHCARARNAGATVVAEPENQFYGDRTYRCLDPEGHLWSFAKRFQTLTLAEMEANTGGAFKLRTSL